MTEAEQHAEAGRLLYERADLKRQLACLESKLDRVRAAFAAAAETLAGDEEWYPVERSEDGIVIPVGGIKAVLGPTMLPSLEDFQRWLEQKHAVQARLSEINQRLPD